jgi:PST family polysaccharide transporter
MGLLKLAKHRLVKDSLILYGVQITGYVLPFVTQPYLARVLGPANIGLIGLGSALAIYFVSVVEYGFAITGPREIAIVQDQPDRVSRIYSTILACRVSLLILSALVLTGLLISVSKYREYWVLYAVSFLQVAGWCLSPTWLLQGLQRMRYVAFSDYGAKIVSIVLIFLLVRQRTDYIMAAALQSGGFVVAASIGLGIVFGVIRVPLVWPLWQDMWVEIRRGWPVFLSMASVSVMTSSNIMILGFLAGNAPVGYLSSAMRLIIALRALTNPINSAIYPHLSKLAVRSPREGIRFLQTRVLWVIVPFAAGSLVLLFFGPQVVRVVFGREFGESGVLLRFMALTPCIYAASMCFGSYMLAFGFQEAWSKIVLWMTLVNFVILGILVQFLAPARAVALTTTLVDAGSLICSFVFYQRTVRSALRSDLSM